MFIILEKDYRCFTCFRPNFQLKILNVPFGFGIVAFQLETWWFQEGGERTGTQKTASIRSPFKKKL